LQYPRIINSVDRWQTSAGSGGFEVLVLFYYRGMGHINSLNYFYRLVNGFAPDF
jgi:hypothetical protein